MRYFFSAIVCIAVFLPLRAQTPKTDARDTYKWTEYDSRASSVKKEAIDFRMLQGIWFAYEGWYYGDEARYWQDYNRPRIFEIKGNQYRSGSYDVMRTYRLRENLLILETSAKIDSAYINLFTPDQMIISFKRGQDFESYKFSK